MIIVGPTLGGGQQDMTAATSHKIVSQGALLILKNG